MTDCILWTGTIDDEGYGRIKVSGKQWRAHRWIWTQKQGAIPPGFVVCHSCDNPSCVNLDHLWLGRPADNNGDRDRKGRTYRGPRPWQMKERCPHGHEYDGYSNGQRLCSICRREATRRFRAKRRDDIHLQPTGIDLD